MKKLFTLCVLMALVYVKGWGQSASIYTYSSSASGNSFVTITSPTTVTTVANGTLDDGNNIITLPFTFTYAGVSYTQMTVTTNGYIVPGSVTGATSTTPSLFTGTSGNPAISGWGRDGNLNSAANGGSLQHGAATGGLYVFQFNKLASNGAGTVSATLFVNFQIVLYGPSSSSPGKIDIIYGTAGTGISTSAQIGIRDAAGTFINGLSGSTSSTTTASAWPGSGVKYSFTPPPACIVPTSLATAPATITPSLNSIAFSSFGAAATAPTGYVVIRSTSNTAPTLTAGTTYTVGTNTTVATNGYIEYVGTSTGSWTSTGLTPGTTYYYYIYSYNNTVCSGGPVYSASATAFNASTLSCASGLSGIKTVGVGGDYSSLTAAITAINTVGVASNLVLQLTSAYVSTTETFPITLGSVSCLNSGVSVTIRPATGTTPTITSSNTTATINISGGSYWIIDGRAGGTGSTPALTIANTSTTTGGTAIQFINDAQYNTVQYATLSAQYTSTTSGIINFITGVTTGNNNNTITFCNLDGKAGANPSPTTGVLNGIYSSGSSTTIQNSNNTISNNNIYDIFVSGLVNGNTNGIYADKSTAWSITGNKIYQTNPRIALTNGNIYRGININTLTGTGFTISNNAIGFTNPSGTGTTSYTGSVANRFVGLDLSFSNVTATASTIQGNTIGGVTLSTTSGASTTSGIFAGIYLTAGAATIGGATASAGNIIGASTGTGSVSIVSTTGGSAIYGIFVNSGSNVAIQNNILSSLLVNSSATITHNFYGIYTSANGAGNFTVSSNTIGSNTTPNAVQVGVSGTTTATIVLYGMYLANTGIQTVSGNNLYNITAFSTSTSTTLYGIATGGGAATSAVTGNTVSALTTTSTAPAGTFSVIGISVTPGAASMAVNQNTIYVLKNTNAAAASVLAGMYLAGTSTGGSVSQNRIYDISSPGTGTPALIGIYINTGGWTVSNNMVSVTNGANTNAATLYGIGTAASNTYTNNFYYNSIYIGGITAGGAISSSVFIRTSNATVSVLDNIFVNVRTGGTGGHFAIANTYTTPATGWASDYNVLNSAGANTVGTWNTTPYSFANWKINTGQDLHSSSGITVTFADAANGDLHLNLGTTPTPIESGGVVVPGITIDFDNQTRPGGGGTSNGGGTAPDLGADEFNGAPLDLVAPTIAVASVTGACSGTTAVVTATITDASGVPTTLLSAGLPVLYYKVGTGGTYTAVQGIFIGSNQYTFTFASGATPGSTIYYYIAAQDNVGNVGVYPSAGASGLTANPPMASTPPTTPLTIAVTYNLSGTYTVGAGGNFTTLTAAVAAYNNACAISGNVVFSLTDATYASETFPITISPVAVNTSNYTLTIKPASGVSPSISGSNATALLDINGGDYIIIDGSNTTGGTTKDLTLSNTSTSGATIRFINDAINNTVKNTVVKGVTTGSGVMFLSTTTGTTGNDNITIQNNDITAGATAPLYGILNSGTTTSTATKNSGIAITGNNIYNFSSTGIYDAGGSVGINYSGNQIYEVTTQSTSLVGFNPHSTTIEGFTFNANRIYNLNTTSTGTVYGIYLYDISSASTTPGIITNNMVALSATAPLTVYGIYDNTATGEYYNIYYNTVSLTGTVTGVSNSIGYYWSIASTTDFRDNIISNTRSGGTGVHYVIRTTTPLTTLTSNYNDLYSGGGTASVFGYDGTAARASLSAWQTATTKDANSISVLPLFASATDLHLIANNPGISNLGTPIATVTTDYDGESRSSTPDMGADEFTACTPPTASASSNTPVCTGATLNLTGVTNAGTGATYAWTGPNSYTSTQQSPSIANVTLAAAGTYTFTVTTLAGCSASATTTVVINSTPSAVTVTPTSAAVCAGSVQTLTASGGTYSANNTILSENFNGATNSWTTTNASTSGTPANAAWTLRADGYVYSTYGTWHSNDNSQFYLTNSDAQGSGGSTNTTLVSPAFSTVNYTSASVNFYQYLYEPITGNTTATVEASINGSTWTALQTYTSTQGTSTSSWTSASVALTATFLNQPTVYIRFKFVGTYRYFWGVDNVAISGLQTTQAPIIWSPITDLYTNAAATTAYTGTAATTVYSKPTASRTYVATATNVTCTAQSNNAVLTLSDLAVSASATNATCNGSSNGTITATATSTAGGITYSKDGTTYQASGSFTGLAAATYTIYAKDANNCVVTATATIGQPAAVTISETSSTDPTCNNGTNGSVTVAGGGGTAPYTYTADGGASQTSGTFTGLVSGSHTFVVTDNNGCIATASYSLNNPAPIVVSAGNNGPVCAGSILNLTATGGTSYSWTGPNGFTSSVQNPSIANATTAASGTYTVTVTDVNGCSNTATTTATVNATVPVSVSLVASQNPVCAGTLVTFTATPTNGGTTPGYQFSVNGAPQTSTGNTFSYTPANGDAVSVILTSNVNCASGTATDQVIMSVTASVPVSVSLIASQNPVCSGTSVTYTATGTGGGSTPTYEFFVGTTSVQGPGAGNTYTYTPANNDQVKVVFTSNSTCATGNPATSNVITMTVNPTPAAPTITAGGPTTFCAGGSVTLTSSYATGNTWSTGATTQSVTVSTAGNYSVTYFDGNCTSPASATTTVTVNPTPTAPTITASGPTSFCTGGSVTLTSSYATGNTWSTGAATQSIVVSASGNYTVTYSNGTCSSTSAATTVTVNAVPTVTASSNCSTTYGGNVMLTATATAGSGTITTYQWVLNGTTNVGTNSSTYTTTVAGSYTVTVTNSNGCSTTSSPVVISAASGPLAAGTYTIGGTGCNTFTTIASALTYINTNGIAGAVIFNVPAGYTETAPAASGFVLGSATLNATLSSSNTLKFVKSGTGANPILTAAVGVALPSGTAPVTPDGIFSIRGADYVTIDGLTFTDNNSASATVAMEFGVGMFKTSVTDGANNNTIQNCAFNMQRVNNAGGTLPLGDGAVAIGIYNSTATDATTALTPTATNGANSNNKIYSNTINGGNTGIDVYGYNNATSPYNYTDQGNDIGGTSASTSNTILNFGGGATTNPAVGIRTNGQYGLNVSYNTINNNNGSGVNHATTLRGLWLQTALGASETVSYNNITVSSGAASSQLSGIENTAGGTSNSNTVAITNNTIVTNYATATTGYTYGIYNNGVAPTNLNINSNTVTINTAATSNSSTTLSNYAIYQTGAVASTLNINSNTVTASFTAASTSATAAAIYNTNGASASTINISSNTFNGATYSGTTGGSGSYYGIYQTAFVTNQNIKSNTFNGFAFKSSGAYYMIYPYNYATTTDISSNVTSGTFTRTGTSGTVYAIYNSYSSSSGTTANIYSNNLSNINNGSSTSSVYMLYWSTNATQSFYSNTFSNIAAASGTGTFYGIYSSTYGTTKSIYNNTISNIAYGGTVYGIYDYGTYTTTGTIYGNTVYNLSTSSYPIIGLYLSYAGYNSFSTSTYNVYKNKISDLTTTSTSTLASASGITLNAYYTSTMNVYNNLIGNIGATATTYGTAVTGINVGTASTYTTTANLNYNTIYLTGTSSGSGFGSAGIYQVGTTSVMTLKNNIVDNLTTPTGSGLAVALKRTSSSLAYYSSASNNNDFYAGTPSSTHLLYYDGTNSDQTLTTFKARVAPAESASVTENPTFLSTTGSSANFLHIDPSVPTQLESGGMAVAGITDDYDGDIRYGNTGYTGTGTASDIGADEFNGISSAPVITNVTVPTATCTPTAHTINATVTTTVGTIATVVLNYNNGTTGSVTMTLVSGNTYTGTIPAGTAGTTVAWSITATNSGGVSRTYIGTSYADAPLTGITATASASPSAVCAGSSTVLTATFSNGSGGTYTAPTAVTNPTTDEDLGNITITQGATTVLNNTTARNSLVGTIGTATGTAGSYSNFTGFGPYTITAGQTYTFSASTLQNTTAFSNAIGIYIDYNRNGVFTDAGEAVYVSSATTSGAHTETGSFTVPASAIVGNTRMRIIVNEGLVTGPTMTVSYGEFEEYTLSIVPAFTYAWSNGVTTVGAANPLTVTPAATTTYTLTATNASGCTVTSSGVTVTVNPLPAAPATTNSIQCGTGVPTASANGGTNGQYRWYTVATGGTALPGETNSTLTSYSISATTTFYVAISNGTCESARTAVTATVTTPDPVTASASPLAICLGASDTLRATKTGTTNIYTYTWTSTSGSGISGSVTGSQVLVTPTIAGSYTYTVTAFDGTTNCTTTSTVNVTVNALPTTPTITASATKVCANTTVTLTASGSAGSSYCTPTYTTTQASGDYISNVTFAGINNNSGDASNDYTYYATPAATVTAGSAYPISLSAGGSFTQQFGVWIDYNQNGSFEASEFVYSTASAASLATGSITIPATAYNGTTRMRIISRFSTAITSGQSCSIPSDYGEAEDYNVTISGGVTNPNNVTYVWSNGSTTVGTTQSITVNPATTTTYTVTVTNTSNCSATSAPTIITIASPLAGVYSVGSGSVAGEAGHYPTLTAAVADYNGLCLGGAVTFALTDATYSTAETFPIVINANSNASATNTLTIKPASGVTSTITGSSTSAIIKLNGADYVMIDGSNSGGTDKSLTITNTSTAASTAAVWLSSLGANTGATYNTVKNTSISTGTTFSTTFGIALAGTSLGATSTGADNDNVTIQNNAITAASIGIYAAGTSANVNDNLIISGNTVTYASGSLASIGIEVSQGLNGTISGNTVSSSTSVSGTPVGISVETGFTSASISKNIIAGIVTSATGGYGGRGITIGTGTANSAVTVSNNFVYGVNGSNWSSFGASSSIGIAIGVVGSSSTLTTTTGGINLYNNSVNLTGSMGSGSTTAITTALYVGSGVSGLNVVDNIFSNTQTATSSTQKNYAVYSAAASTAYTDINYNDYYFANSGNAASAILGYLTSDRTTLAAWQTASGKDVNSVNINPLFTSNTDLHISIGNGALDNLGTPVSGITTDIDNETRSATTPDIGADEYTATACSGTSGGTIVYNGGVVCTSGSVTLTASGYPIGTSVTYQWQYSNDNFASDVHDVTGQTSVPTATTGIITSTTYFRLKSTCTVTSTIWYSNTVTVTVSSPSIVSTTPGTRCGTGTVTLQATGSAGTDINWYTTATGGVPATTGTSFTTPVISSTTTYYAEAADASTVTDQAGKSGSTGADGGFLTTTWGVVFNTTQSVTLNSTVIYPTGTGTITLALLNSSGTELASTAAVNISGATGASSPVLVPLGFTVPTGTGYRLVVKAYSGITDLVRDASAAYPYNSTSGALNVTGSWNSSAITSYYYYFYNLVFSTGCKSTRTALTATVTPAPTVSINPASASICAGSNITLTASSTNSGYTYTWSPGNATGATQVYNPAVTTTYTVTAKDNTSGTNSGCVAIASAVITADPAPTAVTVTPSNTTICAGTVQQLIASGGTYNATEFTESFNSAAPAWTKTNTSTGGTPANADWTLRPNGHTYSILYFYYDFDLDDYDYYYEDYQFRNSDSSQFYLSNADAQGSAGITHTTITSPAINTTDYQSLSLKFNQNFSPYSTADSVMVQVSTDGINFTTIAKYTTRQGGETYVTYYYDGNFYEHDIYKETFASSTVNLSSYINKPTLYIRFKQDQVYGNWWAIDNVTLSGVHGANITWSPVTGLYTNASGTTAYAAGTQATTVYAKPSATTVYTATAKNDINCTSTATATVTVNPLPDATISASHSICAGDGSGVVISSVSGGTVYYHTSTNATEQNVVVIANGGALLTDVPTVSTTYTLDSVKTASCITFLSATSTITINPLPTASISGSTTICKNGSATITFTGTANAVVRYTVNSGTPQSITLNGSGTATLSTGSLAVTTTYALVDVTNPSTTCSQSITGSATVTANPYITWTGLGGDANWSTPGNWCSNSAPLGTESAEIPSGTPHDPVLNANTTINGLTIDAGATVDLNGKNFTTGTISGGGKIIGSLPSTMTTTATGTLNFDAAHDTITNLIVNGGTLTLGSALNIRAGAAHGLVTIATGATLNTGGFLTLQSDSLGTAAVGQNLSGTTYITGNVTVERYTDAKKLNSSGVPTGAPHRAWRLITSPVTGGTVHQTWQENAGQNLDPNHPFGTVITGEGLNAATAASRGFDYVGGGNHTSIRQYDSSINNWVPLSTNGTIGTNIPLHSHQGYMLFVRGDRSVTGGGASAVSRANIRATGALQQGTQTVAILPNGAATNYTLVGNPYASTIDFSSIYTNNSGAITDEYYGWNSHIGTYGAYILVDHLGAGGNYEATPSPFTATPNVDDDYRYIQSGSAFFVSPPATNVTSTTLSISETDKVTGAAPPVSTFRVVAATNVRQLLVNLNLQDNDTSLILADGFRAKFSDDYIGNEEGNSSRKAWNFNENLNLWRDGNSHIIEARRDVRATDTLFVQMWNMVKRGYQLQMRADNFASAPGVQAWLVDSYLGTRTPISLKGDVVSFGFTVSGDTLSSRHDRFLIVFRNSGGAVLPVTLTSVKASPQNGGVAVSWAVTHENNIKGYTVEKSTDGGATFTAVGTQQPARNNAGAALATYSGFDAKPMIGDNFYRIRIEAKDDSTSYSSVVRATIGSSGTGIEITIYPNPVREGRVNLQMTNLEAGTYLVSVHMSGSGQAVYQRKIAVAQPNATQSEVLVLGAGIAQGSYQLRVADHTGTVIKAAQLVVGR